LKSDSLNSAAQEVLDKLVPVVEEVETMDGRWFSLRVHPYRTTENLIAGVVMSFVDINRQMQLQEEQGKIIDTMRESVLVLDPDLRITSANLAFYRIFQMSAAEAEGKHIRDVNKCLDIPQLGSLAVIEKEENKRIENLEIDCDLSNGRMHRLRLNGYLLHVSSAPGQKVLLVMEEIDACPGKPSSGKNSKGKPTNKK